MELPAIDGLEAFGSETVIVSPAPITAPARPAKLRAPARRRLSRNMVIALATLGAVLAGGYAYMKLRPFGAAPSGSVTIETAAAGVEVFNGNLSLGRTPLTLTLAPGPYDLRLGSGDAARPFHVNVAAGASLVEHFDASPSQPAVAGGVLHVESEPAQLPVALDGVYKGVAPLDLESVGAGDHTVSVGSGHEALTRAVHVVAGQRTSVIVTAAAKPAAAAVSAGWLSVASPIVLRIREGGRTLGASDVDRLMLTSGEHDLELGNESLGFRVTRKVNVAAGKTTPLRIDVPNGTLSLNALPWAEVFLDGKRIGETPVGNISCAIGRHEVLFRHPQLGERREIVTVAVGQLARLGIDLRSK